MTPRTIAFLGKSGSGKGTQIELLAQKLKPALILHTGGLFRALAEQKTLIGRRASEALEEGGLQPTWLAAFLWQRELVEKFKGEEHLIFDGSPRRVEEAQEVDEVMAWLGRASVEAVLVDVSDEEAIIRLLKRSRADDTREAIEERLAWFKEEVEPVINYYEKSGRLRRVDGVGSVEEVFEHIKDALKLT